MNFKFFYHMATKNVYPPLLSISLLITVQSSLCGVSTVTDVFHSEAMDKDINYRVVLPNGYSDSDETYPVLYALHGARANEEPWSVMAPLNEAIDGDFPAIIVTFDAERSSYVDDPADPKSQYTTFFFEELVPFIESEYRAGGRPGLRAVTGFSMGGYGAWHYMLEKPDFFCSVSALSGAFDRDPKGQTQWNPYNRIPIMAEDDVQLPPTYMNCGSLDRYVDHTRRMQKLMKEHGYTPIFVETSDAGHDWPFWRDTSDDVIHFHYQFFEMDE